MFLPKDICEWTPVRGKPKQVVINNVDDSDPQDVKYQILWGGRKDHYKWVPADSLKYIKQLFPEDNA